MFSSKKGLLLAMVILLGIVLVACQPEEVVREVEVPVEVTRVVTETIVEEGEQVEVTRVVTETEIQEVQVTVEVQAPVEEVEEPITFDFADLSDIPTLDPQITEDAQSLDYIEGLFVQLTNVDLETQEILPEAATSWEISDDGLVYTFNLRTDIPWVYHNPATGETTQEVDEEGNPRFVTAQDFVYGFQRACDPNTGSYYSTVIAPQLAGCTALLNAEDPAAIPQELYDGVGAVALSADVFQVTLEFPASFFLSMTPMWTLSAAPSWAVEEHGESWIEAGNIVTNGRYVLAEWIHNVRNTVLRNPLMPEDMQGDGNVDRVIVNVVPDDITRYALWLDNEIERASIPEAELQAHLETFPDETIQVADLAVFGFIFRVTKPPFDDVHVRRAFSYAFDRETYVTEVRQGQGLPMTHFAPPGIFGAPPINEVGIGFDPDKAQEEMALGGYPNCEGFPAISIIGSTSSTSANWLEFAAANLSEVLGCPADLLQVQALPFAERLAQTAREVPDEEAANMWIFGWGPDYADENNWVGDVFWCEGINDANRPCSEVDDLIVEAREETDSARRIELYAQIEDMLFGPEGELPGFPQYLRINFTAQHSWLTRTPALFGGEQWYNYQIDQDAKLAAQGE